METEVTKKITVVQTGDVNEVDWTEGMTAKQALAAAGLPVEDLADEGLQVRINNAPTTDLDVVLAAGDLILVVGNIAGA
jgi:hypothetical protein